MCFALALWNGVDPIVKERLYGITNSEANHGEDVKEYYFYLDSTPTHSYMKYLYKYPQAAFPYEDLKKKNQARSREEMEYELLDTGIFDEDRYFDVFVEYAKELPEDILIKITVWNRGPEAASLHVLPTLWFRNTWSWQKTTGKPRMKHAGSFAGASIVAASHRDLGTYYLYCENEAQMLFTENETNNERIFGTPNTSPYVKDGINNTIVNGQKDAVNPEQEGTKAAAHYEITVGGGESKVIRLRLTQLTPEVASYTYAEGDAAGEPFGSHFDKVMALRLHEADGFYDSITPDDMDADRANVMRQALAGMLWSKQHYFFDLDTWLEEHGSHPFLSPSPRNTRNSNWFHMINDDIISMPDKWEYPWYAAWDLAFHTIALSMVDLDFAKKQLDLMLGELYLHPTGQIPAYEWNFGDVNPPVHAWATYFIYSLDKEARGEGDVQWLKGAFQKLLMNFTWWVNRKDPSGKNVFEGGFLGLDNIGVFDRSAPLPTGGRLEQADGTAWMALFSQNMLDISFELAMTDPSYEDMALKFFEHFLFIAAAMDRIGDNRDEMWDEQDGFFYDLLRFPDGTAMRLKVRSMVGLLPLCAVSVVPMEFVRKYPRFLERAQSRLEKMGELVVNVHDPRESGYGDRRLLSILSQDKLRRVLATCWTKTSSSVPTASVPCHATTPSIRTSSRSKVRSTEFDYLPAESNTGMFGGNSNWRGPIWMPVNVLLVRSLLNLYTFYGDEFLVETPTGSGNYLEPLPDRQGSGRPAYRYLPARCARPSPGLRRLGEVPERSALEGLHPVLRVLPRRQWRRPGCEPSDRLDRHRCQGHPALWIHDCRAGAARWQIGSADHIQGSVTLSDWAE